MNATLSCREARAELGAWIDGEAPPAVRDAVAGHLADCAACRAEAGALREVRLAVSALPVPALPADFTARTVERARAVMREREKGRAWLRRLGAGLKASGRFLLGPADPAPLAFRAFWRGALASGMTLAGLSLLSAYVLANAWCCQAADSWLVPRASYEAARSFPLWNALLRLPALWTIVLVALPLAAAAILGARCLRLGALVRELRTGRPLQVASVAALALGALALITFVGVFLIGVIEIVTVGFASYPRYELVDQALPWLARLAIGGVALGTLAVVAARCTRGVTALAAAFYATLAGAFAADQAVATAASVLGSVQANLEHVALTVAGASPQTLWPAVLGLPALGGFFMGVLLSLLAWRTARPGVILPGGLLALALAALLALGGWEVRHHLEARWQLGMTLEKAARLVPAPAGARSVLVLFNGPFAVPGSGRLPLDPARGTRMPAVYRKPVPADVDGGNARRLELFLAEHPHSLLAGEAYRALMEDAAGQWDEPRMLELWLRYAESQTGPPWEAVDLLFELTHQTPTPARLAVARALADPRRFVAVDARVQGWLARALDRQGDPIAARALRREARAARAEGLPGPSRPRLPIAVRDGQVSGRLLLDGRPLAGAPVRLISERDTGAIRPEIHGQMAGASEHDRSRDPNPRPVTSQLLKEAAGVIVNSPSYWERDDLRATRTDADGRFHFRGLLDATYVPAVLIYADLSGWSGRVDGAPGLVTVAPGHARVDMGDIHLTLQPGAGEAEP